MKLRFRNTPRPIAICFSLALLTLTPRAPFTASSGNAQGPKRVVLTPSKVLDEVSEKRKAQPSLTPLELADYANKLIEEKGFDYDFDVCGAITKPQLESESTHSYRMHLSSGGTLIFSFTVAAAMESLCGECFSDFPSLSVTRRQMTLIVEGRRYRVNRPASFLLDEAELVDETMRKVLRTWQLPYQTVPLGVSADGTKLYVDVYQDGVEGLVLELSEDGLIQFRARSETQLQGEGTEIEKHPKDPKNAYLSFMEFQAGGKKYIVRFSAPCT